MGKRARAAACTAAMLFAVESSSAQDPGTREELERLKEIIESNTSNLESFDTNGFHVVSSRNQQLGADFKPDGHSFQMLDVTAAGVFRVGVEKGRPMSTGGNVGVFHRETGTPMLSAGDRDGDGVIDILTHAVLDEAGQAVLEVVDYEADGQADMRIHFRDGYVEIWHVDRWYRTEVRGERRGIVVDGEFVELRRVDNRWIVP